MRLVSEIVVSDRHRADLGDVTALCESIERLGLLHPIVIRPDGRLVAGARRLAAVKQLGWESAPVTEVPDLDTARLLLEAERDENTCRLDMKPSEKAALGRELEKLEAPKAAERKGRPGRERSEKFSGHSNKGRTRDLVGAALGMSGITYQRAKKVLEAAEAGEPGAQEALDEMDKTGKVAAAAKKVGRPGAKKRPQAISVGTVHGRQQAEANKRRLGHLIGTCGAITAGASELRIDAILEVSSDDEVKQWDVVLRGAQRALREVRTRLGATEQ